MFTINAEPGSQRYYPQDKKSKSEIKKELEECIAKRGRNENADMLEKVNGCLTNKDAVKAIQEFEQIIQNKKSQIVWLAYYQGQIFQNFRERERERERERFVSDMALKFNVSKSTIVSNRRLPKNKKLFAASSLFQKIFEIDQRNMQRKH